MKDRVPTKPNRYAVYDDAHNFIRYEYHERADEPTQEGDPLNKANLLPDAVATALGLTGNPQVKDAFVRIASSLLIDKLFDITPSTAAASISVDISGVNLDEYSSLEIYAEIIPSATGTYTFCNVNIMGTGACVGFLGSTSASNATASSAITSAIALIGACNFNASSTIAQPSRITIVLPNYPIANSESYYTFSSIFNSSIRGPSTSTPIGGFGRFQAASTAPKEITFTINTSTIGTNSRIVIYGVKK